MLTWRTTGAVVCALAALLCACEGEPRLFVRVKTDFAPAREFDAVTVRVADGGGASTQSFTRRVGARDDFAPGVLVAELVPEPVNELVAELLLGGLVVATRRVTVAFSGTSRVVTVVLTRNCIGVTCDEASVCFNAACVDPTCTEESPEGCGSAVCRTDADCTGGTECSRLTCSAGACLEQVDDAVCAEGESCVAGRGCVGPDDGCPALPVVEHPGGAVETDEIWPAAEYVLARGLEVNATLQVADCSVLRMPASATIGVGSSGRLLLDATDGSRTITLTRTSDEGPAWSGINLRTDGSSAILEHVVIEGAGADGPAVRAATGSTLSMRESRVTGSRGVGLSVEEGALLVVERSSFVDNGDFGVEVTADAASGLRSGTYGPNAREGILVRGGTVRADARWLDLGAPYVIRGVVGIAGDSTVAVLVVLAGTELRMESGASIVARARSALALLGTDAEPIAVSSALPTPRPGDWDGIELSFDSIGSENRLEHVVLRHAGASDRPAVWVRSGTSVSMSFVEIRESGAIGLEVDMGADLDTLESCTIVDGLDAPISVPASELPNIIGSNTLAPNAIEAVRVIAPIVRTSGTWLDHGVPYALESQLTVQAAPGAEAVLTLGPGVVLRAPRESGILVQSGGALELDGAEGAEVVITSSNPTGAPGDWSSVWIQEGSVGPRNVFRHAILEYGGLYGYGALRLSGGSTVTLDHVTFRDNEACDLDSIDGVDAVNATASPFISCR